MFSVNRTASICAFVMLFAIMPVGSFSETVVVDDLSSGFSTVGSWSQEDSSNQSFATSFQYAESATSVNAQASWSSQIQAATYTVSVWYADGSDRCPEASYVVQYHGGVDNVTVDQTIRGGQWIELGTYLFSSSSPAKVTLSNEYTETGKHVVADAVRFVQEGTTYEALYQGAWVYSWGTGFLSESQTTNTINDARTNNMNCLFPEIRKTGDAYYISSMEPRATNISGDYVDPLADFLAKAHDTSGGKQYIEVHAWMVPFRVWSSATTPPAGHVLLEHPEWVTYNYDGVADAGVLDPGIPEVEDYLVDVFLEVVENYDVDGIHYDYIRYLGQNAGYNPVSLARFQKLYGRSDRPATNDAQWSQFRREQISALVRKVYAKIKQVRWDVKMSASTITWLPSPPGGNFMQTRPYYDVFQDWPEMMRDGSLDLNCPMNYMRDHDAAQYAGFRGWCDFAASVNHGRHTIMGPGTYLNYIYNSVNQMNYSRDKENVVGNNIYRYGAASVEGNESAFWRTIKGTVYDAQRPVPEADWLSSPSQGIVCGTVTDLGGNPLDGATVTLSGGASGTQKTDGTGFFAFLRMDPGTGYTATAQTGSYSNSINFSISAGIVTEVTIPIELPTATPTDTPTITPTATITPTPTATPTLAGEVFIIDDDDELENQAPGWTTVGFEKSSWGSGFYDGDKHFAGLAYPPSATFEWNFGSVKGGLYELYVWTQGTSLDAQADYRIESNGGQTDVTRSISQDYPTGDNNWRDVVAGGALLYLNGQTSVTLDNSNVNSGGENTVYADACRLVGPVSIVSATLPFSEDFESNSGLNDYWRLSGTGQYRSVVTDQNGPHGGNYHLVMDSMTSQVYSRNELTLAVDLSGWERVVLEFWAKDMGDESHTPDSNPFMVGDDFDGVAISQDGNTWYEVQSLTDYSSNTYIQFQVDLDAAIRNYGLQYTETFFIRFNHYDNYPATTDGYAFDDISISGIPADNLKAEPIEGFSTRGIRGQYCTPSSYAVTLRNSGQLPLEWRAALGCNWLAISSASGTLQGGGIEDIELSVNGGFDTLSAGSWVQNVTFTNVTSGKDRIIPIEIAVFEPRQPDFFNFDAIESPRQGEFSVDAGIEAIQSEDLLAIVYDGTAELSASRPVSNGSPEVVITECVVGVPDGLEIQNVAGAEVDTAGWIVAVGDDRSDLNDVHSSLWHLPDVMEDGQILYHDEDSPEYDWSSNVNWVSDRQGWAMIIDGDGNLVDFVCWGADEGAINAMSPVIDGHVVTVAGHWRGDGISSAGIESLQRIGAPDTDSAADFINRDPGSISVQNAGLAVPFPGMRQSVDLSPTVIGPFVNGSWDGTVTFTEAGEDIVLSVQDVSGAQGRSNRFDITAEDTPTPTATPRNGSNFMQLR